MDTKVYKPKCYDVIQSDKSFGVIDLPSGYNSGERYLMYQTLHHIPIVYAARDLSEGRSEPSRSAVFE